MQVTEHQSLISHNSFGIDARARYLAVLESTKDFMEIRNLQAWKSNEKLILGEGSNILFARDFGGLILLNRISGIHFEEVGKNRVEVTAGGGLNWHKLVMTCLQQGYGGIENLSLIPGTVGAAPMQNIGAYGVEISEVFKRLLAINLETGEKEEFDSDRCEFGYRDSIFKKSASGKYLITEVTLNMTSKIHKIHMDYGDIRDILDDRKVTSPSIGDISDAVIRIRRSKLPDPKVIGNAGSFFKNPIVDKIDFEGLRAEFASIPGYEADKTHMKIPAAWLIQQCGWKGKRLGPVGMHDLQALVLVNYGGATGEQLVALGSAVRKDVAAKFGIVLEPEVNIIGGKLEAL